MNRLIFAVVVLLLAGCEQLGMDHVQVARQALQRFCSAPPDGLATLLPEPAQREALARLCSLLGLAPRLP